MGQTEPGTNLTTRYRGYPNLDYQAPQPSVLAGKTAEDAALRSSDVLEEITADLTSSEKSAVLHFVSNRVLIEAEAYDVELSLFSKIISKLDGERDYSGITKKYFNLLVFRLTKFLHARMNLSPNQGHFSYLATFPKGKPIKEIKLQLDLYDYLCSAGYVDMERVNVGSGRADLYIPQPGFRFVIEVKRTTRASWSRFTLRPFLKQSEAYQATDKRLGILAVLDLSTREPGNPHFEDCMGVHKRRLSSNDIRNVVVIRTPGNRRSPSDQPKTRKRGPRSNTVKQSTGGTQ